MWQEKHDPLPADLWFTEIGKLEESCLHDGSDTSGSIVRRAFQLARLAPRPIGRILASPVSENEIEAMLERGETTEAAATVVGSGGKVGLPPRQGAGRCVASFGLGDERPVSVEAGSPALALVGAWARFFMTVRKA
ncbi:MAG: hypothetical protein PHE36_09575 [Novosphingobium sp.]|nr:hypothetical protein [Novosphingobium sp.]